MTYSKEMYEFLEACGCASDIYTRKPVRIPGATIRPLTRAQRNQVERLSTERGYRRFTAELMGRI